MAYRIGRQAARRFQTRVKGGRLQMSPRVTQDIFEAIDDTAAEFGCSRSFVIATLLADACGIPHAERYDVAPKTTTKMAAKTATRRKRVAA